MSQSKWHWQSKVNRLQKMLEQNALNCTFDSCTSSMSDPNSTQSVPDVDEVNAHALCFFIHFNFFYNLVMAKFFQQIESEWSTTPSNGSECLMDVINYSDFEAGQIRATSTNLKAAKESLDVETYEKSLDETVECVDSTSDNLETKQRDVTFNAIDPIKEMPEYLKDIGSCIPLLELIKSSVVKVIDDQIALVRNKTDTEQKQLDRRIQRMKKTQARRTAERQDCIQLIRTELTDKMKNVNNLLNKLETI